MKLEKKKLDQKTKQRLRSIDDEIKAIKCGDKYRYLDHVADWYSEKCHEIKIEERIREYDSSNR